MVKNVSNAGLISMAWVAWVARQRTLGSLMARSCADQHRYPCADGDPTPVLMGGPCCADQHSEGATAALC